MELERSGDSISIVHLKDDYFIEKYDIKKIILAVKISGLEITMIEPITRLRRAPSVVRETLLHGIVAAKLDSARYIL